jgi:hypothetical protein
MKETTQQREYSTDCTLYLALELSQKKWKLGFTASLGQKAWKRNWQESGLGCQRGVDC